VTWFRNYVYFRDLNICFKHVPKCRRDHQDLDYFTKGWVLKVWNWIVGVMNPWAFEVIIIIFWFQCRTLWGGSFKSPLPPEFGNLVNLQYLYVIDYLAYVFQSLRNDGLSFLSMHVHLSLTSFVLSVLFVVVVGSLVFIYLFFPLLQKSAYWHFLGRPPSILVKYEEHK
jgi:hypothetical protein